MFHYVKKKVQIWIKVRPFEIRREVPSRRQLKVKTEARQQPPKHSVLSADYKSLFHEQSQWSETHDAIYL